MRDNTEMPSAAQSTAQVSPYPTLDEVPWGVDSEYGRLLDALFCPPDHFRWLPTSAISQATLDSGRPFDWDQARRQHAEMVSIYEGAGVRCHFLEAEDFHPYGVFSRDSSVTVDGGAIVTQPNQPWRRGETAVVSRFYEESAIPIVGKVSAASLEGGDFMIIKPGVLAIGTGEARTETVAAQQVAGWLEPLGWEVRLQPIPEHFVHLDVLACMVREGLAAVCTEAIPGGFVHWLAGHGVEVVDVDAESAERLGVNLVSLGDDRVVSTAGAAGLNADLQALGLEVFDPDLSSFTLGGGGPHCLMQALRRCRVADTGSSGVA